jgi:excisionase family DNA binding protein
VSVAWRVVVDLPARSWPFSGLVPETRRRDFPVATTPRSDPAVPLARLLSIVEVAEALGVDVRHVRRLVHEKRIPYIKWGHLLRFDRADIATWVDAYRRYPDRTRGGT